MCLWCVRISFLLAVRFSFTTRSYASICRRNPPKYCGLRRQKAKENECFGVFIGRLKRIRVSSCASQVDTWVSFPSPLQGGRSGRWARPRPRPPPAQVCRLRHL
jgi:hypothetical protein